MPSFGPSHGVPRRRADVCPASETARVAPALSAVAMIAMALMATPAMAERPGSPAWFNAFNAQRGAVNPAGATPGGPAGVANVAPNSPAGVQQNVQRSVADFANAARVIAAAQAAQATAQAQARAAAKPATAPNGLSPGGLQVDPGALRATAASPSPVWKGAALPRATTNAGRTTVTVDQTDPVLGSKTADLTWKTFNIGAATTLNFKQGGTDYTVLNRVSDPSAAPSTILGAINAPGLVLVLNANGVLFGPGSQVNVGSLAVAAADLAQLSRRGRSPASRARRAHPTALLPCGASGFLCSFTNATGPVSVAAGASIATNTPASAVERGGYVLLLGQSVRNDGQIITPSGQTVLAAGQGFIVTPGYSQDNNPSSTTLGLQVAPIGSGTVVNTGLIQATTGDITLTGQSVTQAGVLLSSTTVGQRGTIHLTTDQTDPASSVVLAQSSLTAILPQDDGATATNVQRAALIKQSNDNNALRAAAPLLTNQARLADRNDQSRIEIVSGGGVSVQGGAQALSTGGQIAVQAAGRVFAASNATMSVAGSVNTVLPASANTLPIGVQPFDMRDAPANRDTGALKSQTMNIAINQLVQIGSLQYTAGGLLEVSGYVSGVGHTIGEWTSAGGSITLSGNEVVAQPGSVFNIAGGMVSYAAGNTATTWLTASNGHLYNINAAPATLTYTGIYAGNIVQHARWGITDTFVSPLVAPSTGFQRAYSVGRDGGTLMLSTPTSVMEGTVVAGVINGANQSVARPAAVADPFTLPQNVVPIAGALTIGSASLTDNTPFATDVRITADDVALAASLDAFTTIPANRTKTTWLDASLLNGAGLGAVSIATKGTIAVEAPLTLADGGQIALTAPHVTVSAALTARGGQISIGNQFAPFVFLDAKDGASVTLTSGGVLDTRGVFTNLFRDPNAVAGRALVNGGAVSIDTSGTISLAAGSVIDASAGGAVLANRSALGAQGGRYRSRRSIPRTRRPFQGRGRRMS